MQLDAVGRDPEAAEPDGEAGRRVGRKVYLPTIVITGLAAWLTWRGWSALADTGVARSFDDGRYQLAGPAVLGFVLAVCVIEQIWPAQRRPVLARGHLLDFCYAVFYALLVVPLIVLLGAGFPTCWPGLCRGWCCPACPGCPAGVSSCSRCSASTRWTG